MVPVALLSAKAMYSLIFGKLPGADDQQTCSQWDPVVLHVPPLRVDQSPDFFARHQRKSSEGFVDRNTPSFQTRSFRKGRNWKR